MNSLQKMGFASAREDLNGLVGLVSQVKAVVANIKDAERKEALRILTAQLDAKIADCSTWLVALASSEFRQ